MPQGLEVYDEQGQLRFSATDRLTRLIGEVYSGSSAGAISVPEFATHGSPWFCVYDDTSTSAGTLGNQLYTPVVTISGTTLSWTFMDGPNNPSGIRQPSTILYGVF